MIGRRDWVPLALIAVCQLILFAPTLFTGRAYFNNDLTLIHHPWRALAAEQLQRGLMPLWNPYSCLGVPLLGNFQSGILHPLSVLFELFPFASALTPFLFLTCLGAGFWTYLWLRRIRACPWTSLVGAVLFSCGGYLVGHLSYPNDVATAALLPALFLFTGHVRLTALAAALALTAGHPFIWAGGLLVWAVCQSLWGNRAPVVRSAAGILLGVALASAALVPGLETARMSSRTRGIALADRLRGSLPPADLAGLIHPAFVQGPSAPAPFIDVSGTKYRAYSGWFGVSGTLALCLGLSWLLRTRPAAAAAAAGYIAVCCLVLLGGSVPASAWLWENVKIMEFIRGPSRHGYLLTGLALALAALGFESLRRRLARPWNRWLPGVLGVALVGELVAAGYGYYPSLPKDYYGERGALVEFLQNRLASARYFQYPGRERWSEPHVPESVFRAYRRKLFGVSNSAFHVAAASGGYEPLVPAGSQAVIGNFDKLRNISALPELMPWAGIGFAVTAGPVRPGAVPLEIDGPSRPGGAPPWAVYESVRPVSRAYWLPEDRRKKLEGPFSEAGALDGLPWDFVRPREDRFEVRGRAQTPGLLYVAEPLYPGWTAYVNGRPAPMTRALEAFFSVAVPAGEVRAEFLYRPGSWALGVCLSALAMLALLLYSWRELRAG